MLRIILTAAALLTTAAVAQDHWNWGTDDTTAPDGFDFSKSHTICRRLGHPHAPAADRPTAAQAASLKHCSSQALYYAPGGKPDYVKARLCAFTESDDDPGAPFRGTAVLMELYANGRGVKRDLDLATAYACELEDSAAFESDGRVMHLQSLKTKPEKDPFDYCDDVTSGVHGSLCIGRQSEIDAIARNARIKGLTDRLPPAARPSYAAMFKALDAFIEARGDAEIDHGGTGHAGIEITDQDAIRNQFVIDLTRLLNGTWPAATPAQARTADAQLNSSYRKALAAVGENDQESASEPTIAGVRATQRIWLTYRDAWLRFAAIAAPGVSRDAILTRITNLRTAQLDEF